MNTQHKSIRGENGLGRDEFQSNTRIAECPTTTNQSLRCEVVAAAFQAINQRCYCKNYGHVLLRSTVTVGTQFVDGDVQVFFEVVVTRKAEIGEFDVTIRAEKHILRFQISLFVRSRADSNVNNPHRVQMIQRENDFSHIQASSLLGKQTEVRQMREQISTLHVIHHHVETVRSLIRVIQSSNKGKIGFLQNGSLDFGATHLPSSHDFVLLQDFHRVIFARFDVENVQNLSISTTLNPILRFYPLPKIACTWKSSNVTWTCGCFSSTTSSTAIGAEICSGITDSMVSEVVLGVSALAGRSPNGMCC